MIARSSSYPNIYLFISSEIEQKISAIFNHGDIPKTLSHSDLDEIIGSGAHVDIYTIKNNPYFVVKIFNSSFIENVYRKKMQGSKMCYLIVFMVKVLLK